LLLMCLLLPLLLLLPLRLLLLRLLLLLLLRLRLLLLAARRCCRPAALPAPRWSSPNGPSRRRLCAAAGLPRGGPKR